MKEALSKAKTGLPGSFSIIAVPKLKNYRIVFITPLRDKKSTLKALGTTPETAAGRKVGRMPASLDERFLALMCWPTSHPSDPTPSPLPSSSSNTMDQPETPPIRLGQRKEEGKTAPIRGTGSAKSGGTQLVRGWGAGQGPNRWREDKGLEGEAVRQLSGRGVERI